ncbi:hypothetical protein E3Q13_01032 [Wallemia mellicola]|nr:hypothetical protein E3Q13_01032 [Wallemia mellicola]
MLYSHTVISYCKLIVLLNKCLLLSSTHTFIIIEREDKRPRTTKSENTLKRGSACITCRRRKMKCDAVKPTCGACTKSRLDCVYQTDPIDKSATSGAKRKSKVQTLEEKIPNLSDRLESLEDELVRARESPGSKPESSFNGLFNGIENHNSMGSANLILEAAALTNPFYNTSLGVPGWHPNYPSLDMTMHLLNTFFNACPIVAGFLHRATFMQRATLPFTHPDAPPPALMHAIFCSASRHSPRTTNPPIVSPSDPCGTDFQPLFNAPSTTFLEIHAQFATKAIEEETVSNANFNRKAEALKALIVMSHFTHIEDKWAEHYRLNVMCIRGAVALRLHLDKDMTPNRLLLRQPRNDIERECRKFLFFLAYVFDTLYSDISGIYPPNINDDEVFSKLPIKTSDYNNLLPTSTIPEYNQYIDSENFFTQHEADGFHFVIKSSVLLARVNRFKHVCQRNVVKNGLQSANQLSTFMELDNLIMKYRASVPDSWGDSVQIVDGGLDVGIYLAHLVGVKAMMSLHSGFIHDQFSMNRLLSCARIILSTIYRLLGTSWDMSKLPSYVVSIYNHASDVLIAAYLQAIKSGDVVSADSITLELSTIVEVYRRMSTRIPVALTALNKLIKKFTQNSVPVKISDQLKMNQPIVQQPSDFSSQLDFEDLNDPLFEQLVFEANATTINPDYAFQQQQQGQQQVNIAPGTAFTARDELRWMNFDSDDQFSLL